ncbi:pyrroline-5-carboxylate reductase [Venturia canescens]|uniref:pyrroline-5-carboxylate reductase n=1 Tax=Venturia canescens TaxID=32260 RepID=UPI001C9C5210|nr:pyrroline-5-carboxylate reductase [Venturia canescens]
MDLKELKIGFIGGGNMARAIGAGLIKKGVLNEKNVWVSSRTLETLQFWKDLGTRTSQNNGEVIENCDVIFIAVKPQMLKDLVPDFTKSLTTSTCSRKLFVSVLVGVTLDMLRDKIAPNSNQSCIGIVRTMPNTPLMVGTGVTVYCSDDHTTEDECTLIHKMFAHLGIVERVPESQMDAISALSGSGPAFAYQIIEGLSDGAVMAGVPRAMATQFAAQVLIGAGNMVLQTKKHPGALKDEVCSPGGTTIRGVHAMEEGGVRVALMNAIKAAVARAAELANQMKK